METLLYYFCKIDKLSSCNCSSVELLNDMKEIVKKGYTLEQAEEFQNELYDIYDTVRLVAFPRFQRVGVYIWEVSE